MDGRRKRHDRILRRCGQRFADAVGGVDKIEFPGHDVISLSKDRKLRVTIEGVRVWGDDVTEAYIALYPAGDRGGALLIGEVPLLAHEVAKAERVLVKNGAIVSALHNHWQSKPAQFFMHFQMRTSHPERFLEGIAHWWRAL